MFTKEPSRKVSILLVLLLFVFLVMIFNKGESTPATQATDPANSASDSKIAIDVTSRIVKKVDGKCRYFFDIRNNNIEPFNGAVLVSLHSRSDLLLAKETFQTKTQIEPTEGDFVYLDANTCPTSEHGEYGITKFKYSVEKDGKQVNFGEGNISNAFENLEN